MKKIENILIFTHTPSFKSKVSNKLNLLEVNFTECKELKEAFDLLSNKSFDILIFETYDCIDGKYQGINETDLDILLYYASGDESVNRYLKFLPIDHESAEAKKAEVIYQSFYERHLLLLNATTLDELTIEDLYLGDERRMLFELVGTLDSACDKLDEKLSLIDNEDDKYQQVIKDNNSYQEQEEFSRITGKFEEDQDFSRVTGAFSEDTDDFSRVSGDHIEDESFTHVSDSQIQEEKEELSRITGTYSEDESFTRVRDSQIQEEKEELSRITGIYSEDESFTRVSGIQNEDDIMKVKSLGGSIQESAPENMRVKHIKSKEDKTTVQEEVDIDFRNQYGQTPLMITCMKGDHKKAMTLIHQGANTSLKCKKGLTLLHYACAHPHNLEVVQYLVNIDKLRISSRAANGMDPLAMAIKSDSSDCVKWLITQGARTESKVNGQPLLHFAAAQNSFQSFLVLLSQGNSINQKCNRGLTAEQFCKSKKKLPFLKALKAYSILNSKKQAA